MIRWRLRDADVTLRVFLTLFLLVLTSGYAIGFLFVEHATSLSDRGVQRQFLGSTEPPGTGDEFSYPKSAREMYTFLHNHILSLSLLFFAVGTVFYFSSLPSAGWKRFLLWEPMAAIVTTFGGIVLMRSVSPLFSWVVILSGGSMIACYCAMVVLIMAELWLAHDRS